MSKEKCLDYCGPFCVNGLCPAIDKPGPLEQYCENCFFYNGCEDCVSREIGCSECVEKGMDEDVSEAQ